MKTSMKFVLLALSLTAVMTAPASAQVFKPRDQTCANPSTARDKSLKPETRCLRPKSGSLYERWSEKIASQGAANANKPLVPGGPPRRDYIANGGGGGGGGGGGSSKGKKSK